MSNELTTQRPQMAVAAKHRRALTAFEDDGGKLITPAVNGKTALIPVTECHAVIAELETALEGADKQIALVCSKRLIGCYRIKDVVDPEIYINTMAEKFAKFPPDIAQAVVDAITDTQVFPPAPAEIVTAGNAMVKKREIALYVARKHLEEHARRKAWRDEQERIKAGKEDGMKHLRAEYDKAGLEWPGEDKASWVTVAAAGMGEGKE